MADDHKTRCREKKRDFLILSLCVKHSISLSLSLSHTCWIDFFKYLEEEEEEIGLFFFKGGRGEVQKEMNLRNSSAGKDLEALLFEWSFFSFLFFLFFLSFFFTFCFFTFPSPKILPFRILNLKKKMGVAWRTVCAYEREKRRERGYAQYTTWKLKNERKKKKKWASQSTPRIVDFYSPSLSVLSSSSASSSFNLELVWCFVVRHLWTDWWWETTQRLSLFFLLPFSFVVS